MVSHVRFLILFFKKNSEITEMNNLLFFIRFWSDFFLFKKEITYEKMNVAFDFWEVHSISSH